MKKIISLILSAVMLFSVVSLVSCGEEETLKLGLGVYTSTPETTDATGDTNGTGEVAVTFAAVTLDKDGKIVKCDIDTAAIEVEYTSDGKAIANTSFKTKRELGNDYNMKLYGGSAKEWFEQADAFETVAIGKTVDEVKALVVSDTQKGNDEVINAGCTISVNEFVLAIEKACRNAVDSNATAADNVQVTAYSEQECTDATADADGMNQVDTTFFAAAVDADGKIVAAKTDCVQLKFGFDATGASTLDTTKAISTKRELGNNYNMKLYSGSAKEWFEQADVFEAATIGKTAGDISALMGSDNYGNDDLKAAGCTINVSGFVKAAAKITK